MYPWEEIESWWFAAAVAITFLAVGIFTAVLYGISLLV